MDPKKILRGKKILIVDDEKDVLDQLIELLEICRVDTASSFEEGKRLLESEDKEDRDAATKALELIQQDERVKPSTKCNSPTRGQRTGIHTKKDTQTTNKR